MDEDEIRDEETADEERWYAEVNRGIERHRERDLWPEAC